MRASPGQPAPRGFRSRGLVILSMAVALILAMPLGFLLIEAHGVGWGSLEQLVLRPLTAHLLWNTFQLTVVVTALCAGIGTGAAWLVERTTVPGRAVWNMLLVVPLAIPDFVVSFGWASMSVWVHGFQGAVLVMTLAIYPLVYLPVAASFRHADPGQEEVAKSLGLSPIATFWRVTLCQARGAILGGSLLVVLTILAEYGAFEIVGYQTFTTQIFSEFSVSFNVPAACALSLVLVLFSWLLLTGEGRTRGAGQDSRSGLFAQRHAPPLHLGQAQVPILIGLGILIAAALGVPIGACVYWILAEQRHPGLMGVSMLDATWHTAYYSGAAAALATLLALPVALLAIRHPGQLSRLLERSTYLVLGMPGLVIALALAYFSVRYLGGYLYQSAPQLIVAYTILFFPLALVGVRASVSRVSPQLEDVARSLRQNRWVVWWRVSLPLMGPGLAAAFSLVFLSVATELTATLILIPTGVETLATQFWVYQENLAYGQAAPFALEIILLAAFPSYVLGQYFQRHTAGREAVL